VAVAPVPCGRDKTDCATSRTLPRHAVVVTRRCEALGMWYTFHFTLPTPEAAPRTLGPDVSPACPRISGLAYRLRRLLALGRKHQEVLKHWINSIGQRFYLIPLRCVGDCHPSIAWRVRGRSLTTFALNVTLSGACVMADSFPLGTLPLPSRQLRRRTAWANCRLRLAWHTAEGHTTPVSSRHVRTFISSSYTCIITRAKRSSS
jgi:hypothetical protein